MDQINTTKDHNYQQLARKDLLPCKDVTLDTSHWLMSALNPVAPLKAVVFGRRKKKKGSDVKMDKIKTTRSTTISIIGNENWQ
jgi:hypothetical protein